VIALLEGISFLVLLGIAMPLKYGAGMPLAVTIVGWAHGALFVLYVVAVARAGLLRRWPAARWIVNLVASIVPAGPFFLEGRLRREQEQLR
jgi:integral membrane protein